MSLKEDKEQYVDYILKVAEICGVEELKSSRDELMTYSLERLDSLSIESEKLYELHKSSKVLDRIVGEIEEFGVEYVKEYYELN